VSDCGVEVVDLHYQYPDGTQALRGVSLCAAPGVALGIIGPNAAGKSTLLLHLNGFLTPTVGEVRIGGTSVTPETAAGIRAAVGVVFQDPDDQLFMPTVFEDGAFGPLNRGLPPDEVERRVAAALVRVGTGHLRDRPPYRLSGGEKRAVAMAAVLAGQPRVLVLDEPTSNLDPRGRRRLIGLLNSFEHTRIIAAHDLELVVEVCSRVVVLDAGRVVAEGPTHDLLNDEALMLAHGLERPHILRHSHPH
jgi:cobalt/nickel transport system ATP-binding protein